ncbi:MAG: hypothetical protein A3I66_18130 [Burkholderiales bacterium RIFCSPLOWO2_02_FULL_57_36]|nr:MAG: hypothetical protein A3I66_18130 [Burkholderiales bacterium RIFCSPLOWO2_02_FULL_57_36]
MKKIIAQGATTKPIASTLRKCFLFAAAAVTAAVAHIPEAAAARCSANAAGDWTCIHQTRDLTFVDKYGISKKRQVRWQVPEGAPPAGGWPVAFFYHPTVPVGTNPFVVQATAGSGGIYIPKMFHELLDDPTGTGKKYAIVAPVSAAHFGTNYWDTNVAFTYSGSEDYKFFPDLFGEIISGNFGPASQYNMNRRYAFGMSSGGFNTSRMAVTFNSGGEWKALGIIAASYATCSASCSVPTLPANHPPTKFWHGTGDFTVPISTMRTYYNKLVAQGIPAEKLEHSGGHVFTADNVGATGVKAYFDRY